MPIKGERLGDAQRFHVGKTFAVDPTDGLVGEFGKPTQCGTGDVSVTPTQPGGAGTKGSLSSPPGWDAVISGLRPEPHVLRAENLRVKKRFRHVVLQGE